MGDQVANEHYVGWFRASHGPSRGRWVRLVEGATHDEALDRLLRAVQASGDLLVLESGRGHPGPDATRPRRQAAPATGRQQTFFETGGTTT